MTISFQGTVARLELAAPDGLYVHFKPEPKVCGDVLVACRLSKDELSKWPLGTVVNFTIARAKVTK